MTAWIKKLDLDPINILLSCDNLAIEYFTRRDLLEEDVSAVQVLWELPLVANILNKQQNNGSWIYPGRIRADIRSREDYNQLETFRMLGELVEKYGLNRTHQQIHNAAEYLFSCQTPEGDFRGIYGNQYATTYSPAIMELLIKAGYGNDKCIKKGFQWLLSMRQEDGGWVIPLRTSGMNLKDALKNNKPALPDRSKPFSHLVTGMVLRAFAAHPEYRESKQAKKAGALMASRFFHPDKYPDRKDKTFWEGVSYPFWFTDIISALDSLSFLGFTRDDPNIRSGLNFLHSRQTDIGLFNLKLLRGKDKDLKYWICLAISRVFKRFYH